MCLNTGTPKTINFPFETNGKLMILGVPILKHFRVHLVVVCKTGCFLNEKKIPTVNNRVFIALSLVLALALAKR